MLNKTLVFNSQTCVSRARCGVVWSQELIDKGSYIFLSQELLQKMLEVEDQVIDRAGFVIFVVFFIDCIVLLAIMEDKLHDVT